MKIKRSKSVTWRKLGDKIILLDLNKGDYYSFDGTALDIWKLCTGKYTSEEIIKKIAAKYRAKSSKCRSDIQKFLCLLSKKGFINAF